MLCAQTYLILLVMAMIIIINDNEDDNDDLMKVLCAHTLLMMMDCTLSWFHKTPFIKLHTVQMLHIVPGTQCSYLHNVQRLYICKKIYTSHADNCTVRMALRCTQLHSIESKKAGAKKYFHTIHLISISLQADALSFVYQFKQF